MLGDEPFAHRAAPLPPCIGSSRHFLAGLLHGFERTARSHLRGLTHSFNFIDSVLEVDAQ